MHATADRRAEGITGAKNIRSTRAGHYVDVKGYCVDVKGYCVNVKGYCVDVKGYDVDVKGYCVDVKGYWGTLLRRT
eukprot:1192873-Prorocentrum_minimum.AAC.2